MKVAAQSFSDTKQTMPNDPLFIQAFLWGSADECVLATCCVQNTCLTRVCTASLQVQADKHTTSFDIAKLKHSEVRHTEHGWLICIHPADT